MQDSLADSQDEMKEQLGDVQHDVRGVRDQLQRATSVLLGHASAGPVTVAETIVTGLTHEMKQSSTIDALQHTVGYHWSPEHCGAVLLQLQLSGFKLLLPL